MGMQRIRAWTLEKAEHQWNQLLNDPAVQRDHKGPDGNLRLCVPAILVAQSDSHHKVQKAEERVIEKHSRIESAEISSDREELNTGFTRWTATAENAHLTDAAPSGGWSDRQATSSAIAAGGNAALAVLEKVAEEIGSTG